VVVVEAPEHSGALITADYALEQGRDLLVHGVSEESPRGAGARALVDDGAEMIRGLGDITGGWVPAPEPGREAGAGGAWNPGPGNRQEGSPHADKPHPAAVGMQLALDLEAELTGGGNG
jgi:predicted Rossmann fold nucleotide-binding protein DprA/Smf involved in DNA uptake